MRPSPMIVRVHDGDRSQDWLIPLMTDSQPDYLFLDTVPRPTGPIELLEPDTCQVVASASPPRSGPGVRVTFNRIDLESERWELSAQVDTLLFPPTAPLASGTYCPETT